MFCMWSVATVDGRNPAPVGGKHPMIYRVQHGSTVYPLSLFLGLNSLYPIIYRAL